MGMASLEAIRGLWHECVAYPGAGSASAAGRILLRSEVGVQARREPRRWPSLTRGKYRALAPLNPLLQLQVRIPLSRTPYGCPRSPHLCFIPAVFSPVLTLASASGLSADQLHDRRRHSLSGEKLIYA